MPKTSALFLAIAGVVLVVVFAIGLTTGYGSEVDKSGSSTLTTITTTLASTPTVHVTGSMSSTVNVSPTSSTSGSSTSSSSTRSTGTITTILAPGGATYQVQSSYDCVAGHDALPFNITTASQLEGGIEAENPGVTLYVGTAQGAQTVEQGHPSTFLYTSGLTNSTSLSIALSPGSYVLWIEGADLNCGASTVIPLEQLTNVTVTGAFTLTTNG